MLQGRRRGEYLARRLGVGLRDARQSAGLTQQQVADGAGVSQGWISELERGSGSSGSIANWASVAAAVGEELVAFFDHAAGAGVPRDLEHLRRQQLLVSVSAAGGWRAAPEERVDVGARRPHFVDVLLQRSRRGVHEKGVAEIWDLLTDVGDAMREFERKVGSVRDRTGAGTVSGVFVVRATRRNRALVREFSELFRARFPGSSGAWLRALTDREAPMPVQSGFLWTDVGGTRLIAAHLRRGNPRSSRNVPPITRTFR
jgi:transcriptional regulator with XRE-family HTH domain